MKNAVKLDENRIRAYLRDNALFNGTNIQNYDLNNLYKLFGDMANKQKMKIKLDAFGVDKFSKKNDMVDEFMVEITYILL
jgi:hypothetical protein